MGLKKLLKASVKAARNGKENGATVPLGMPPGFLLDKEGELILPRTPAECADLLYRTREERLRIQRHCETLEKGETRLKDYFVETLPANNASGIAGLLARVQIERKAVPQVADWGKFYAYVRRNAAFELLQRRLNESAIKERLDDKKPVPGVTIFNAKKVSCTKL